MYFTILYSHTLYCKYHNLLVLCTAVVYNCRICQNNEWRLPPVINCTADHCPLVEAILDYARDNLVMFNIFIKVRLITMILEYARDNLVMFNIFIKVRLITMILDNARPGTT